MFRSVTHHPFGSAFSVHPSLKDLKKNLIGSVPLLGIYIGVNRIARVASVSEEYIKKIEWGISRCQIESASYYRYKHYFRGVLEILGLGSVLTILELATTVLYHMLLGLFNFFGICHLMIPHLPSKINLWCLRPLICSLE